MSSSFYDIVPQVLTDKVHKYAGCCINCGKLCSGDIVPELGEYYCYEVCGPEYKHFDPKLEYKPFNCNKYLKNNVHLGKAFLSYLKTHYLYNRLDFEYCNNAITIYGINHYKYEFEYDLDEDLEDYEYLRKYFEGYMELLIVAIMKNTLDFKFPEPCCTNGIIIGHEKKWCKCSYALSYKLTNYFETENSQPPFYVTYVDDIKILDMLKHLYKNDTSEKTNAVIFVPKKCESYTDFFDLEKYGRQLDYDEKIKTKYGSFIVVYGKNEKMDISRYFFEKVPEDDEDDEDDDNYSVLKDEWIKDYIENMSSPILMKYHNNFFDGYLLNLLHKALNCRGDEEYIAIIPKKFLKSSTVFIESMMDDNASHSFTYVETEEAFFFSNHH